MHRFASLWFRFCWVILAGASDEPSVSRTVPSTMCGCEMEPHLHSTEFSETICTPQPKNVGSRSSRSLQITIFQAKVTPPLSA